MYEKLGRQGENGLILFIAVTYVNKTWGIDEMGLISICDHGIKILFIQRLHLKLNVSKYSFKLNIMKAVKLKIKIIVHWY